MALTSTVHVFVVQLADADRNVYESLDLRLAQHPSRIYRLEADWPVHVEAGRAYEHRPVNRGESARGVMSEVN